MMQFGFVAIYLSESFVRGFMTAAGLQILISVLKYIFGITVPPYSGPLAIIYVSIIQDYNDKYFSLINSSIIMRPSAYFFLSSLYKHRHLYVFDFLNVSCFGTMLFHGVFCISDPRRHMHRPAQNQHSFSGVCPCQLYGVDHSKRTEHMLPS